MKHPKTAQRMRQILDERGITQTQLSEATGISRASISQYVNGVHTLSNLSAEVIGTYTHVNPLWLMEFDVDKDEPLCGSPAIHVSVEEMALIDRYRKADNTTKSIIRKILNIEVVSMEG